MKELLEWTTDIIRANEGVGEWLEERKLDWVPLTAKLVKEIIKGNPIIILTDDERSWFGNYFVDKINNKANNRPFVPVYLLDNILPNRTYLNDKGFDYLEDMLSITHKNYKFFYIGKADTFLFRRVEKNSFYWLMDSEKEDGFYMKSYDKNFDKKLLDMFRLLNLTITSAMFSEVSI